MTKSGNWKEANTDTVNFKFIKNDKYILGEMGGIYNYDLVFSYDKFQQKYRMSSIDQVSGLLDIYEGNKVDGKLVIDNHKKDTYYTVGSVKYYNRLTISKDDNIGAQVLVEGSDDGGQKWQKISLIELIRL